MYWFNGHVTTRGADYRARGPGVQDERYFVIYVVGVVGFFKKFWYVSVIFHSLPTTTIVVPSETRPDFGLCLPETNSVLPWDLVFKADIVSER